MNRIKLNGRTVNCGVTPTAISNLGFKNPGEVAAVAMRYGRVETPMCVADVADWFDEHYGTVDEEAK